MLSNCSAERFCDACDLDRLFTVGLVQPYEHEGEAERSEQSIRKRTDNVARFATGRDRGQRRDADQMVQTGAKSGNFVGKLNWSAHITPERGRAGASQSRCSARAVRSRAIGAKNGVRGSTPPRISIAGVRIMPINASPDIRRRRARA